MNLRLAASLLLLSACTAPPSSQQEPSGLQSDVVPAVAPQTFEAWIETLPPAKEILTQAYRADFHMAMDMTVLGQIDMENTMEVPVKMDIAGVMTVADPSHLRYDMDLKMDLSGIPEAAIPGPLEIGFLMIGDGETFYVAPELADGWLKEQLATTGIAIEKTVFTLDISLVEQLLTIYTRAFEKSGMDMSLLIPEGMTTEEYFHNSMQPALWTRSFLATTDVLDYDIDASEVRIRARLKPELFSAMMIGQVPGQEEMLKDLIYDMTFDRASGMPKRMAFSSTAEGEYKMDIQMDLGPYLFGKAALEGVEFHYTLSDSQTEFPLDTWVQLMLTQMESMIHEDDEDASF